MTTMTDNFSKYFEEALEAFDAANGEDPNKQIVDGVELPYEQWYAKELYNWIVNMEHNPSEALLLAARCQHIERWKIDRSDYPDGRKGYLKWRADLGRFHAERAGEILRYVGYDEDTIEKVQRINLKKGLKTDHDTQLMEDALNLMLLQYQIDDLIAKHDDEKVISILQKTWNKMTERGHAEAMKLKYSPKVNYLIEKAVG